MVVPAKEYATQRGEIPESKAVPNLVLVGDVAIIKFTVRWSDIDMIRETSSIYIYYVYINNCMLYICFILIALCNGWLEVAINGSGHYINCIRRKTKYP